MDRLWQIYQGNIAAPNLYLIDSPAVLPSTHEPNIPWMLVGIYFHGHLEAPDTTVRMLERQISPSKYRAYNRFQK